MTNANLDSRPSILLISAVFPPDDHFSGAARAFRFYKYLPRVGFKVLVVTASRHVQGSDVYSIYDSANPSNGLRNAIGNRLLRPFVAFESSDWMLRSLGVIDRIVADKNVSAVVSTSPPVISNLMAAHVKRKYKLPWIADFRDPLVGNPFRSEHGISGYLDRLVQKRTFDFADALIANTDACFELWRAQHPEHMSKAHVIWNGFDPDDGVQAMPIPRRECKLITHVGSVYGQRNPSFLLNSVKRLIEAKSLSSQNVRIWLAGPFGSFGPDWSLNDDVVGQLVRAGVLAYHDGPIPKDQAVQTIASADALLLIDSQGPSSALQVPAKLFDYIRIGRPILAITKLNSPADRMLKKSGVPYVGLYDTDSTIDVDKKVLQFTALPTQPVLAHDWFWNKFGAEQQARQLASVIEGIIAK